MQLAKIPKSKKALCHGRTAIPELENALSQWIKNYRQNDYIFFMNKYMSLNNEDGNDL